jgi:hypothetical protein
VNIPEGFQADLTALINKYSLENGSNTPDFLLADYLVDCLAVFNVTMARRERWYGRAPVTVAPPLGPGDLDDVCPSP